ncbi:MAG: mannose-6-phosphate isomerase [Chitinivibrionales bacterium]|nr:mannose-6-phosphate isomerase [Chitinivibrionales bacterium]
MTAPLACRPIFKEKIWGGRNLHTVLGKTIPPDAPIGESWELSGHGDDVSVVADGVHAGSSIAALADRWGKSLLGARAPEPVLPLLYKFIDAEQRLSVQVHPDDRQAREHGWDERGKTECWYVVHARPDARIIVGLKEGVTLRDIDDGIRADRLGDLLNELPIAPGDVLFIPAGTVHAIMEGTLLYEVQETSDITLRLYDWGRVGMDGKPRALHVAESLEVIDARYHTHHKVPPLSVEERAAGVERSLRAVCRYFALEEIALAAGARAAAAVPGTFQVLTCIEGHGEITASEYARAIGLGETILVPADCQEASLSADTRMRVLRSWVPDIAADIVQPLLARGADKDSIAALGGDPAHSDIRPYLG